MDNKKTLLYLAIVLIVAFAIVTLIYGFVPSRYHRIIRTIFYLLAAVVATVQAKRLNNKNK